MKRRMGMVKGMCDRKRDVKGKEKGSRVKNRKNEGGIIRWGERRKRLLKDKKRLLIRGFVKL